MARTIGQIACGRTGKCLLIAASVAALGLLIWWTLYAPSAGASSANERVYICAETGQPFDHRLVIGEMTPVYSPHSDRNTGYPSEPCYWTADGSTKDKPTYVLLNSYIGSSEPTFCPDCGRLVVPLNPAPAGGRPPPLRYEYEPRVPNEEEEG